MKRKSSIFAIPNTKIRLGSMIRIQHPLWFTRKNRILYHHLYRNEGDISYYVISIREKPKKGMFLFLKHGVPYMIAA